MTPLRLAVLTLGLAALVLLGCSSSSNDAVSLPPVTSTPPPTSEFSSFELFDPDSVLMVKGRDRLRVCVESLEDGVSVASARDAVQEALLQVAEQHALWPPEFGSPLAAIGCPLPPVPLDQGPVVGPPTNECDIRVSAYSASIFIANADLLREAFPLPRIRTKGQEGLFSGSHNCAYVNEGWYITPEELTNEALEPYIISLFIG